MKDRWISVASEVFTNTKYRPSDEDVASLAEAMALVEAAGLRALIQRLIQANRKIFDTIAELNLAVMLIRQLGGSAIEYEPDDYGRRPVDFRIRHREITIYLQMKRFGDLERDNRRNAVYERIQGGAAGIDVRKFFGVALHDEFSEDNVDGFLKFLAATAAGAVDGDAYDFGDGGAVLGTVEFWAPTSTNLQHLTLGSGSDAGAVNITMLAADQLRASMRKTAAAFIAPIDAKNINLVVAESDKHHDIDICEACFGTEEELFGANGRHAWHRLGDGVFAEAGIAEKVAGLVVLRRSDRYKPVTGYEALLLINEPHIQWVDQITKVIPVSKVVRYNMRP